MTINKDQLHSLFLQKLYIGIIGTPNFCLSLSKATQSLRTPPEHFVAQPFDGWRKIVEYHPNMLIIEADTSGEEWNQSIIRELIQNSRERYGDDIVIAIALSGVSQLLWVGNLLFESLTNDEPSSLIDFFITLPTITLRNFQLGDLLNDIYQIIGRDKERREKGGLPLPRLNSPDWVQSIGDLQSLELWMKWLPRYALYLEENPIIIGRTGTGKTRLSKALHYLSGRKGNFISMTPRDFSSSELIQAELFGAVAGAYTGAVDKWGLVKSAEKGTLFLDEFQSIDLELQGKLITFIENKSYRRVGSTESTQADVRFIFASNKSLFGLVQEDLVREDFAYRLERVMLELLPLHTRPLDIAPAIAFGLAKLHRQRSMSHPVTGVSLDAYELLLRHPWPGNLRQLENFIAKACERAELEKEALITIPILHELISESELDESTQDSPVLLGIRDTLNFAREHSGLSLTDSVKKLSSCIRHRAIEATGGDAKRAASLIRDDELLFEFDQKSVRSR